MDEADARRFMVLSGEPKSNIKYAFANFHFRMFADLLLLLNGDMDNASREREDLHQQNPGLPHRRGQWPLERTAFTEGMKAYLDSEARRRNKFLPLI